MWGEDGDFPIELPDIVSSVHSNFFKNPDFFKVNNWGKGVYKKMLDRKETTDRPAAPSLVASIPTFFLLMKRKRDRKERRPRPEAEHCRANPGHKIVVRNSLEDERRNIATSWAKSKRKMLKERRDRSGKFFFPLCCGQMY